MSARTIKLTIEYDGTDFHGWQIQKKNNRTVQGEIEKALQKILKHKIRVIGSGRTDRGVHAVGQVAHLKTSSTLPALTFLKALNNHLPEDIAILKVEDAPDNFHAQYSVQGKIYRYTILNRTAPCAHLRHLINHFPYQLNVAAMRQEAKSLIGKKDFKSFQAAYSSWRQSGSTIRTIKRIAIHRKDDFIHIDIEADGFLYKMARNIVGTLLDIGTGKLPKGSIKNVLAQKTRTAASKTAPAKGLCLLAVKY